MGLLLWRISETNPDGFTALESNHESGTFCRDILKNTFNGPVK
jgi:hypothetical protein